MFYFDFPANIWFPKLDAFDFSTAFLFSKISAFDSFSTCLILKMWSFDFSNDTFHFRNLSRLIYQMALLISEICLVCFLKWHFWFPKFVAFDFSNGVFYFQNETDMDLIHVTVSVGGKPYSRTGGHSVNGHNTTKRGSKDVLAKNGDVLLDRVWVSQGGFPPLCPKQGYILILWRQQLNHIFNGCHKPFGEKGK